MLKIAVIGDPIEHSLSPKVHGAALDALGVKYEYEKTRVKKGGLLEYISYATENNIDGFNLTMPHKVDILPYLEAMDEEAEAFSSVNTVCIRDKKLYGYNTDAIGYRLSLESCGYKFRNSRVVILGAGGVVRTLSLCAALDGAESIKILNRTEETAKKICGNISDKCRAEFGGFSQKEIEKACENADILINATPLGMLNCPEFESLKFLKVLPKGALVSDLIYNPNKTKFLSEAEKNGNKIINGLGMLIYQALAADEYYLDRKIDVHRIYKMVEKALLY